MASPYERRLASWLVSGIAGERLQPDRCLDGPSAIPGRRNPDVGFTDSQGNEYIVEVTRLLSPRLLEVYAFALDKISRVISPALSGLYVLNFRVDALPPPGVIPRGDVVPIIAAVEDALKRGSLPTPFEPLDGYEIKKLDDTGAWLEPFLLAEDVQPSDDRALALQRQLESVVAEADQKLEGYPGRRILLVDIGQAGLDAEFHSLELGGIKPLLAHWTDALGAKWPNVQEIYLQPGVPVWTAAGLSIRSPTRYTGEPRGFHIRMRPTPVDWVP